MATIDTSYVRRELRAIADSSNAVKHLLRKALEKLEQNPSSFPPLEEVPGNLTASYPNLALRKIKLRSGKHNYRLVVAPWTLESGRRTRGRALCLSSAGRISYRLDVDRLDRRRRTGVNRPLAAKPENSTPRLRRLGRSLTATCQTPSRCLPPRGNSRPAIRPSEAGPSAAARPR